MAAWTRWLWKRWWEGVWLISKVKAERTCWQVGCGNKQEIREGAKVFWPETLGEWSCHRLRWGRWLVESSVGKTNNSILGMLCVRRCLGDSGMLSLPFREGVWATDTESESQSLASARPSSSPLESNRCLKASSPYQLQGLCICYPFCLDYSCLDDCCFCLVL